MRRKRGKSCQRQDRNEYIHTAPRWNFEDSDVAHPNVVPGDDRDISLRGEKREMTLNVYTQQ